MRASRRADGTHEASQKTGGRVNLVLVVALLMVVAACTTDPAVTTTTTAPAAPPTSTMTAGTTTTSTTEPVVVSTEVFDTFLPEPMERTAEVIDFQGGASIGDSYYPLLGNAGYDVTHVDLAIDFRAVEDGRFTGEATLHITPLEPIESLVIDTGTLLLSQVHDQTEHFPNEWVRSRLGRESDTEYRIGLAGVTDEPFKIRIAYRGVPEPMTDPAIGFPVGIRPGPDSWFAVSEPSGATTWFPANDHPLDKATYSLSLTVDEGLIGIAGGLLTGSAPAAGGGTTFTWEHRHPLASYLLPLAVGRFDMVEREAVDGIIIRDFIDPDIEPGLLGNLDRTGEFLAWMVTVFGEYPFDAYGTLAVDIPFGGALETQTLATHGPDALGSTVIVHEMAHMWFGDSLSLGDFSEMWLNEGFATYAQWLRVESERGVDMYNKVARSGFETYLESQAPGNPAVNDLFNAGVYLGGASVLHALRVELGDGPFFALIKAWAQDNAYANVRESDFIDMSERFAARQLDDFFETWLSGAGEEYTPLMP